MILPLTPFSLQQMRGLTHAELTQRVILKLEDQSHVVLRDEYIDQLHRLCNETGNVDTSWLNCDATSVYFVTRTGTRLSVCATSSELPTARPGVTPPPSMHVVLDQSGSMFSMNDAVYAGAREIIEDLPEDAVVTFTTFNHIVTLGERRSRDEGITSLRMQNTSGTTALRDAIVRAVEYEETEPHQSTTIIIVTDGVDNASTSTIAQVQSAVQRCTHRGWKILFIGANQNAITTASHFGIDGERALTFDGTRAPEAFRSVADVVRRQRTTGDATFTPTHRQASLAA